MKRILSAAVVALLMMIVTFASQAISQEAAKLEGARIEDESSLIKSILIVCDGNALKYSVAAEDPRGIKTVEVIADDRIVAHKVCGGASDCSASGVAAVEKGLSTMFTATVVAADGRQYSERVKVRLGGDVRVYFVGTAPAIDSSQFNSPVPTEQPVATSATGTIQVASNPSEVKLTQNPASAGPEVTIDVQKQNENEYFFSVSAFDAGGVDFIEILENGVFMDVQTCSKQTRCEYRKAFKNKNPGRNKYMVKSMNTAGALTFQEQILLFSKSE